MAKIRTNAGQLAARWYKRAAAFNAAVQKGIRNAAILVNRKQVENLSGNGPPNSWPVRNVTGNLMRGAFYRVLPTGAAVVGNTARYAFKIHEDRPFLDFAVNDVDAITEVQKQTRKVFA